MADDSIAPAEAPPGIYDERGQPRFFADPSVDRLVSVMLEMASALWVLTERVETIERVAAAKGYVTLEELRFHAPPASESAEREAARTQFVHQVLGPLREAQ